MEESIETVIIGAGQAGLSLSYFLTQAGKEHIVLEKSTHPGSAWRDQRWDSFTLVTPNFTYLLPGDEYAGDRPDDFMPRIELIERFERYAQRYRLPVRYSTRVERVRRLDHGMGFAVEVGETVFRARNVVVATGLFQQDKIPPYAAQLPPQVLQLGSSHYRNPALLPPGAVVVIGSGQSGCQIAEELNEAGRKVFLSTGSAGSLPRRYRGREILRWLVAIGFVDRTPDKLPSPAARFSSNPLVTGKNGGHELNLHQFSRDGIVLLGRVRGFEDGKMSFAPDLKENLKKNEQLALNALKMVDDFIAHQGLDVPERDYIFRQEGYAAPEITRVDPRAEKVGALIWAVGYAFNYTMVEGAPLDDYGFPITQRGVTQVPGLYFLGMPWLHTMKSGILYGVGADAAYLAERIGAGA